MTIVVDEKHKNTMITDEGWDKVERLLGIENISDPENWAMKHHVETAVKAHAMYRKDVEYVVKDGEVLDRGRVHRTTDAGTPLV